MDLSSRIADLATPAASQAGLVVDSVSVTAAGKRSRVVITLDLPEDQVGSADLDAIAAASRGINAALDKADPFPGAYVLEISTPGTDRPLTERRHYLRARTRLVHLDVRGGGAVAGRLTAVEGDELVIQTAKGDVKVPLADVARGRIEVELKRIAQDDVLYEAFDGDANDGEED